MKRNRLFIAELTSWLKSHPRLFHHDRLRTLSNYERFVVSGGGRPFIELAMASAENRKNVLVLGAFRGDSIKQWLSDGRTEIVAFEPVQEFLVTLGQRFGSDKRVTIIPAAAGSYEGQATFAISEDRSGSLLASRGPTSIKSTVQVLDFDNWLASSGQKFGVTEINIEGAEYELIQSLSADSLRALGAIMIQFHNFESHSENLLSDAETRLEQTHFKALDIKFVWSLWLLKF